MLNTPPKLARRYTVLPEHNGSALEQRPHFRKWLRYYLEAHIEFLGGAIIHPSTSCDPRNKARCYTSTI